MLALSGCAESSVEPAAKGFQVLEDFAMTQTVQRKPVWKLSAPTAHIEVDGAARLDAPEIAFYKEGKHTSTAHARSANVAGGSNDVLLSGDVVIEAHQEKAVLRTQKLIYSAKVNRIRTDEQVVIERPGATVRGKGMEADSDLNDITLFHQETVIR